MEEQLIQWFSDSGWFAAAVVSMIVNILISLLGIIPSVFLTAANISFFGFTNGLVISILGEAFGAIISFYLYRKGIKKFLPMSEKKHRILRRLQESRGSEAFLLIIALRIFPLIPSGFVTLAGALSRVNLLPFSAASTIGKIPALLIEAYSVKEILDFGFEGKIILTILSIVLIFFLVRNGLKNDG
ncbi:TVP38/TMEM64 family protein [Peribacillus saganii]|uniref:TVP38/TMEM64 family membrane protein n=1 Tax=Peribacillus saganii TaxID=2303992 RepID=A0A372LT38_9BACI|nr:VTT domain-containing protein [Peribacillus saganii]RFU70952.1 TVP38/TMEM64 family protein [Peribacillus saganii]